MPFNAYVYRLLVSGPSDVAAYFDVVDLAVGRWNATYGALSGANVMPTNWRRNAAAEHGVRPQASLNQQLVEDVDILIALFWHRLGSDTGEAASGTVEEIQEAVKAGAYVAILKCTSDIPAAGLDPEQIERLSEFLKEHRGGSLVLEFENESELERHVEAVLNRAIAMSEVQARADAAPAAPATTPSGADVWPQVERSQGVRSTPSSSRVETRWDLVLRNRGDEAALNVRFELKPDGDGEPPMLTDDDKPLRTLPPDGQASYRLLMHSGVAAQADCTVTWEDADGGTHENEATLRFF